MKNYNGLLAALVTPYNADGTINHTELRKLVRYLLTQGIDGFYVGGSTAEAFILTEAERKAILDTVAAENNGEKLVVSHVGHISTDQAISLAKHAKSAGADAISAISPFYYQFTQSDVQAYYFDIIESVQMPAFIYHFPALSGFNFAEDTLANLLKNQYIKGIKYTSNDFFEMERIRANYPDLVIWNGYDEMLLSGLSVGASGGIGSTYNCFCPLYKKLFNSFNQCNIDEARAYQSIANEFISVMQRFGVIQSIKALLELRGFTINGCRRPFSPIAVEGREKLAFLFNTHKASLS